jgi:hypothetical protein
MIYRRYFKVSPLVTSHRTHQKLSSGNGFGSSTLRKELSAHILLPLMQDQIAMQPQAVARESFWAVLVTVSKILLLTIWLWCLSATNCCADANDRQVYPRS